LLEVADGDFKVIGLEAEPNFTIRKTGVMLKEVFGYLTLIVVSLRSVEQITDFHRHKTEPEASN
jgi:hypothetical protein